MARKPIDPARNAQFDRFVEAAKKLETDDSEAAFERVVRKVAKATPKKGGRPVKNSGK